MREVHRSQFQLGQVPIEEIWINPKSRDDIPAVLKGLQHIWCDEELRERLFALLDEHILPEADRTVGRPGMDLWQILVLGVLKQGLGCDFDRLHELTNHHETIRAFLGHADWDDKTRYEYQTVVDNVSLLTPELLSAVGRLVVESGHKVAKKKPGEPLRGRCDSFVVETDVHYPTDVNLLWDAVRWCARLTGEGQPVEVRRKEGVTNHFRPESCAGRCEAAGEALTGARTGRAIEHRKRARLERRDCHSGRRQHRHHRNGEGMAGSTVSENPCTFVRPSSGPGRSSFRPGSRTGAAAGRRIPYPMMHGMKKSDEAIVPVKAANKGAQTPAESPEGRASTKGNLRDQSTHRTQGRDGVSQAVERIRQAATPRGLPSTTQGRSRMR